MPPRFLLRPPISDYPVIDNPNLQISGKIPGSFKLKSLNKVPLPTFSSHPPKLLTSSATFKVCELQGPVENLTRRLPLPARMAAPGLGASEPRSGIEPGSRFWQREASLPNPTSGS
eukprot:355744-Hanusia_phi.AAC.2